MAAVIRAPMAAMPVSTRLPTARGCPARQSGSVLAHARPNSSRVNAVRVARSKELKRSLERTFLKGAAAPAPPLTGPQQADAASATAQHRQQQQQKQQQDPAHGQTLREHNNPECVEQEEQHAADAADAAALPAAAQESPDAVMTRWLDMIPLGKRARGIVMLNLLVILVATNWVVVKDVGGSFDPLGFAFLRFFVAAVAFLPFMKAATKDGRIVRAGMELGMWTAAGYITQSLGLLTTDASRASFLSTFTVLVVPFLVGMSGKGVSAVTWASCVAALVGVGLLEQNGAAPGIGDVWSMLSAVAFGIQIFRTEHWARIIGNGSNLPLMSVVLTTTMGFAAVATGATHFNDIVGFVQHPESLQQMMVGAHIPWAQVLYCGLLTTDLALLLEVLALQDVSSVEAAIIYTLEPVLGASLAWAVLGERLGAKGLMGAGIIVASSLATQVWGNVSGEEAKLVGEGSADGEGGSEGGGKVPTKRD